MALNEPQISILVTDGGFVVGALVRDEWDDWTQTTAMFTDVYTMVAYVARVSVGLQGPAKTFDRLGPLKVENDGR